MDESSWVDTIHMGYFTFPFFLSDQNGSRSGNNFAEIVDRTNEEETSRLHILFAIVMQVLIGVDNIAYRGMLYSSGITLYGQPKEDCQYRFPCRSYPHPNAAAHVSSHHS